MPNGTFVDESVALSYGRTTLAMLLAQGKAHRAATSSLNVTLHGQMSRHSQFGMEIDDLPMQWMQQNDFRNDMPLVR
jgi:hypothetical protein